MLCKYEQRNSDVLRSRAGAIFNLRSVNSSGAYWHKCESHVNRNHECEYEYVCDCECQPLCE